MAGEEEGASQNCSFLRSEGVRERGAYRRLTALLGGLLSLSQGLLLKTLLLDLHVLGRRPRISGRSKTGGREETGRKTHLLLSHPQFVGVLLDFDVAPFHRGEDGSRSKILQVPKQVNNEA